MRIGRGPPKSVEKQLKLFSAMVLELGVDLRSLSDDLKNSNRMTDSLNRNWGKLHDYHDGKERELLDLCQEISSPNLVTSENYSE